MKATETLSRVETLLAEARAHAAHGRERATNNAMRLAYFAHIDHLDAIAEAHGYADEVSEAELAERDAATASFDAATLEIDALLSGRPIRQYRPNTLRGGGELDYHPAN